MPPTRFYAGLAGRFVRGFVSNLLRFLPGRGPPTWLRPPGVPFRVWFCEQSSAFSSRRGGHQLGYAGLACRFVTGFVSNLLRFLPDGGAANLVTPAWRAVSCVVLWAISYVFLQTGGPPTWLRWPGGPFRVWFCQQSLLLRSCSRRIFGAPGGAGLGAPGVRD